jgi:hypothetical protein
MLLRALESAAWRGHRLFFALDADHDPRFFNVLRDRLAFLDELGQVADVIDAALRVIDMAGLARGRQNVAGLGGGRGVRADDSAQTHCGK